jgi:hypothetical protein
MRFGSSLHNPLADTTPADDLEIEVLEVFEDLRFSRLSRFPWSMTVTNGGAVASSFPDSPLSAPSGTLERLDSRGPGHRATVD